MPYPLLSRFVYKHVGQRQPDPPPLPVILHHRRVLGPLGLIILPVEAGDRDDLVRIEGIQGHQGQVSLFVYLGEVAGLAVRELSNRAVEAKVYGGVAHAAVEAF
jgi:hypothetical protein